jgi:hypothetical protein
MKNIIIIIISYLSCIIILSFIDVKYGLGLSWWMYFLFGGLLLFFLFIIIDMIPIKKIKNMFSFRPSKQKIIRELAILRINKSAMFRGFENKFISEIINMPDDYLTSLPEGSIITIIETYLNLQSQGMPEKEIIEHIDIVRSTNIALISGDPTQLNGGSKNLPSNLTLDNYIRYRINKELDWAISKGLISLTIRASFSKEILDEIIEKAFIFFKIK